MKKIERKNKAKEKREKIRITAPCNIVESHESNLTENFDRLYYLILSRDNSEYSFSSTRLTCFNIFKKHRSYVMRHFIFAL